MPFLNSIFNCNSNDTSNKSEIQLDMIRDIEEGKASRRFMLARLDIKKEQIHDIILKMDIIKLRIV